jgi:hypothetical protein
LGRERGIAVGQEAAMLALKGRYAEFGKNILTKCNTYAIKKEQENSL